jgi:hypothetical protein
MRKYYQLFKIDTSSDTSILHLQESFTTLQNFKRRKTFNVFLIQIDG